MAHVDLYTLNKEGAFERNDDRRELLDFLLPFGFAMLLGLTITVGGQYLLFGVATEKESRILESLLCNVSAEELLAGKLLGLGAAGLTLVVFWIALATPFVGAAAVAAPIGISPSLLAVALLYFLFGYLFYASLMIGIGSITSNMREAQQFSVWFTFSNFAPFIVITMILSNPGGALATGLSMFPLTASTTMLLRLTAPSSAVPAWQIALSLTLLAGSALAALMASARVFRIGLLMYGKTPSLPEILRWARQG
jgi:ABC-2 type transport system permease protein